MDEAQAKRARLRPMTLVIFVGLLVAFVIVLGGCASPRYLTEEQDAEIRKVCEPAGCHVMPMPLWREIQQFFRQLLQHKDA